MELDELKQIWKEGTATQAAPTLSAAQIRAMLYQRAQNCFDKILRNLRIELAFSTGILVGILVYIAFAGFDVAWQVWALMGFVTVIYLASYPLIFRYLQAINIQQDNLVLSLQKAVATLRRFIRVYTWVTLAMMPPSAMFGAMVGAYTARKELGKAQQFSDIFTVKYFLLSFFVGIFVSAVMYYPVKWYFKKAYRSFLDIMEDGLRELQENGDTHPDAEKDPTAV
jgi:hypothetical protein